MRKHFMLMLNFSNIPRMNLRQILGFSKSQLWNYYVVQYSYECNVFLILSGRNERQERLISS